WNSLILGNAAHRSAADFQAAAPISALATPGAIMFPDLGGPKSLRHRWRDDIQQFLTSDGLRANSRSKAALNPATAADSASVGSRHSCRARTRPTIASFMTAGSFEPNTDFSSLKILLRRFGICSVKFAFVASRLPEPAA